MINREKVIKGFECCHVMVHDLGPDKTACGICPYKDVQTEEQIDLGGIECIAVLHDDALALLKQEAVVHCGDCENFCFDSISPNAGRCILTNKIHSRNWFCAHGKREDK